MGYSPFTDTPEFPIERIYENIERREQRKATAQSFVNTYIDKLWQIPTLDEDIDIAYKNNLIEQGSEGLYDTLKKFRYNVNKAMPELMGKMTDITMHPFWTKNAHALTELDRAKKLKDQLLLNYPGQVYEPEHRSTIFNRSVVNEDGTFNDLSYDPLVLNRVEDMAQPLLDLEPSINTPTTRPDPNMPFGFWAEQTSQVDRGAFDQYAGSEEFMERLIAENQPNYLRYLEITGNEADAAEMLRNEVYNFALPVTIPKKISSQWIDMPEWWRGGFGDEDDEELPPPRYLFEMEQPTGNIDPERQMEERLNNAIPGLEASIKARTKSMEIDYEDRDGVIYARNQNIPATADYNRLKVQQEAETRQLQRLYDVERDKVRNVVNRTNKAIDDGEYPLATGRLSIIETAGEDGITRYNIDYPGLSGTPKKKYSDNYWQREIQLLAENYKIPIEMYDKFLKETGLSSIFGTVMGAKAGKDSIEEKQDYFDVKKNMIDLEKVLIDSRGAYKVMAAGLNPLSTKEDDRTDYKLMTVLQNASGIQLLNEAWQPDIEKTADFRDDYGGKLGRNMQFQIFPRGITRDKETGRWISNATLQEVTPSGEKGQYVAVSGYENMLLDVTDQVNSQLTQAEKDDLYITTELYSMINNPPVSIQPENDRPYHQPLTMNAKTNPALKGFFGNDEYTSVLKKDANGAIENLRVTFPGDRVVSYGNDVNRATREIINDKMGREVANRKKGVKYTFTPQEYDYIKQNYKNADVEGSHEDMAIKVIVNEEGYSLFPKFIGNAPYRTWGIGFYSGANVDDYKVPENYDDINKHKVIAETFGKALRNTEMTLPRIGGKHPRKALDRFQYAGLMTYAYHTGSRDKKFIETVMTMLDSGKLTKKMAMQFAGRIARELNKDVSDYDITGRANRVSALIFHKQFKTND